MGADIKLPIPPELLADLRNPFSDARKAYNRFISEGQGTHHTSPLATTFETLSKMDSRALSLLTHNIAVHIDSWILERVKFHRPRLTMNSAGRMHMQDGLGAPFYQSFNDVVDSTSKRLILLDYTAAKGGPATQHSMLIAIDKDAKHVTFIDPHGFYIGAFTKNASFTALKDQWVHAEAAEEGRPHFTVGSSHYAFQLPTYGGVCVTLTLLLAMFLACNYEPDRQAFQPYRLLAELHALHKYEAGSLLPLQFAYYVRLVMDTLSDIDIKPARQQHWTYIQPRRGVHVGSPTLSRTRYMHDEEPGSVAGAAAAAAAPDKWAWMQAVLARSAQLVRRTREEQALRAYAREYELRKAHRRTRRLKRQLAVSGWNPAKLNRSANGRSRGRGRRSPRFRS
jgi:hypothetical protein